MECMDTEELIVPDEVTERIRAQKAKAKAEAQKYIEQGKKQLGRVADAIEAATDQTDK